MNLRCDIAVTKEDVEAVRIMRNAGREWMTADQSEISPEQQREWWNSVRLLPRRDFLALVFTMPSTDSWPYVGYGVLSRREGRLVVSLAVAPAHRGQGFGRQIYRQLAAWAHSMGERCYAIIRSDNVASVQAAVRAGYEIVGTNNANLNMVTDTYASVLDA